MENDIKEFLRNLLIGSSASIPFIGGVISVYLDKTVPDYVNNQYETFVIDLKKDIFRLKEQINLDVLEKPEFSSICFKLIKNAAMEIHESKRCAYKNIFINSMLGNADYNMSDYYLRVLFDLSAVQFEMLIYSYYADINKAETESISELMKQYKDLDTLVLSTTSELTRLRLTTGTKITNLGRRFCQFINSPQDIISKITAEHI